MSSHKNWHKSTIVDFLDQARNSNFIFHAVTGKIDQIIGWRLLFVVVPPAWEILDPQLKFQNLFKKKHPKFVSLISRKEIFITTKN